MEENKNTYSLVVAWLKDDPFKTARVYKIPFLQHIEINDYIIVDTEKGDQFATVTAVIHFVDDTTLQILKAFTGMEEKDYSQVLYRFKKEIMEYGE